MSTSPPALAISATAVPAGDCSTSRTSSGKVWRIVIAIVTRATGTPTGTVLRSNVIGLAAAGPGPVPVAGRATLVCVTA